MLVSGQTIYCKINELSKVGNQYDLIFKTLFGNDFQKARDLHAIACSDRQNALQMLQSSQSDAKNKNEQLLAELRTSMFDNFLSNHLKLDQESIDWFANLTIVALGGTNGIEYISQQYHVPINITSLLKAICTTEISEMDDLFVAMNSDVNY